MAHEKRLAAQIQKEFKLLGYYQVIGGVAGMGLMGWLFILTAGNPLFVWMLLGAVALFAYSIYCGYLLLQQKEKGLLHSQVNQALQILHFTVLGFSFEYASGMALLAGFDISQDALILLNFNFSAFRVKFYGDTEIFKVQINLFAILLIVLLEKLKEKIQKGKLLSKVADE